MKSAILLLTAVLSLSACKEKKQEGPGETIPVTETASPADDSTAIRKQILDFYSWYTTHYEKLMGYQLYKGEKKNDQPPYQINWEEVERYQAFIRDSIPYLGDGFLANQRTMLKQCDSAFKASPEDEIPYGFDYDWYTNSQEDASYLLKGLETSGKWIIQVKGDEAFVEIGAPDSKDYLSGSLLLFVGMKKENGIWTINRIGND